jgi:hypothetical protein
MIQPSNPSDPTWNKSVGAVGSQKFPGWITNVSRLDPGWIQVGSRLDPGGIQVGSRWDLGGIQVGSRWDPGGIQVGSRWDPGWDPGWIQVGSRWDPGGIQVGIQVGIQNTGGLFLLSKIQGGLNKLPKIWAGRHDPDLVV